MSSDRRTFEEKGVLVRKPGMKASSREEKKEKPGIRSALMSNEGKSVSLTSGTGQAKSGGLKISLPPKLNTTVSFKHTFRFVCRTGNTLAPVTGADLLLACGCVATSATTIAGFVSSVKVHSIKIWTSPNASTTDNVAVQWQSPITAVERDEYVDQTIPVGVTVTGGSVFLPPADTFCAKWVSNTALAVFSIIATTGSIVDLTVSATLSNALGSSTATGASGLTTGAVYYNSLDGATTSSVFLPVGVPAA